MLLTILLILIFLGVFGSTMLDSLWGNTLRFLNLIFAATLATALGEPLAMMIENYVMYKGYFFYNFVGIWFVFALTYAFFRFATQHLSRVNVKFHHLANLYGGKVMAGLVAMTFVSFLVFTLHQAPLGNRFLGFNEKDRMFFGTAPDRQWHDYMSWVSSGVYFPGEKSTFDPEDDYAKRYAKFRASMQAYVADKSAVGVEQANPYAPKRP